MSTSSSMAQWESRFASFLRDQMRDTDAAHDRAHVERVVNTARRLADDEDASREIVIPAAWLHDCVVVPKNSPDRAHASQQAAKVARTFLSNAGYPEQWIAPIEHAIAAHSYSANIPPETTEAKVVQDADRLDALGAVGIARCFMVGGDLGHALYNPDDPFCEDRPPDDEAYSIDHFYAKLLNLPDTMKTDAGRKEAERRAQFMRSYLEELSSEIGAG